MTRGKTKRSLQEIKELIAGEEDILRPLIGGRIPLEDGRRQIVVDLPHPVRPEKTMSPDRVDTHHRRAAPRVSFRFRPIELDTRPLPLRLRCHLLPPLQKACDSWGSCHLAADHCV